MIRSSFHRHKLSIRSYTVMAAVAAVMAAMLLWLAFSPGGASAQPPFPILYEGTATIGGRPAPDGTKITARVGRAESRSREVVNGRYALLVVDPSLEYSETSDVVGLVIEFFADGVRAVETDVFVEGQFLEKTLDLNFPELPATGDEQLNALWPVLAGAGIASLLAGLALLRWRPRGARG